MCEVRRQASEATTAEQPLSLGGRAANRYKGALPCPLDLECVPRATAARA